MKIITFRAQDTLGAAGALARYAHERLVEFLGTAEDNEIAEKVRLFFNRAIDELDGDPNPVVKFLTATSWSPEGLLAVYTTCQELVVAKNEKQREEFLDELEEVLTPFLEENDNPMDWRSWEKAYGAYARGCEDAGENIGVKLPAFEPMPTPGSIIQDNAPYGPVVVGDLETFRLGQRYRRYKAGRHEERVQATRLEERPQDGRTVSQTYHLTKVEQGWRDAAGVVHVRAAEMAQDEVAA